MVNLIPILHSPTTSQRVRKVVQEAQGCTSHTPDLATTSLAERRLELTLSLIDVVTRAECRCVHSSPAPVLTTTSLAKCRLEAAHSLVDVVTRAERRRAHKALAAWAETRARCGHDVAVLQDVREHVPVVVNEAKRRQRINETYNICY